MRDLALLALMFNTGVRVREVLDQRRHNMQFEAPHQMRLVGKGNKAWICPIWPRIAQLLLESIAHRLGDSADHPDARGS